VARALCQRAKVLLDEPVGLEQVGDVLTSELGRPRASVRPRSH
jgi:hypothetical protein